MKTTHRLLVVFAAAVVLVAGTGCKKLQARDHLNKGVQAYKNAKYEQAIDHFQQSVALDPTLINARLYLATAFAQQYIPGAPVNQLHNDRAIRRWRLMLIGRRRLRNKRVQTLGCEWCDHHENDQ